MNQRAGNDGDAKRGEIEKATFPVLGSCKHLVFASLLFRIVEKRSNGLKVSAWSKP
jgi:hypothetical protein